MDSVQTPVTPEVTPVETVNEVVPTETAPVVPSVDIAPESSVKQPIEGVSPEATAQDQVEGDSVKDVAETVAPQVPEVSATSVEQTEEQVQSEPEVKVSSETPAQS